MRPLLLLTHNGLGDHLICNGLVRTLAARRHVTLVCKAINLASIAFMYRDIAAVQLLPVEDDSSISPRFGANPSVLLAFEAMGFEIMLLGLHRGPLPSGSGFADAFYDQAGVDRTARYQSFKVVRDNSLEHSFLRGAGGEYVLLNDDPSRGYAVEVAADLPMVRPGQADHRENSDNIFSFIGLIESAKEYHSYDTAFSHLADLLNLLPGRRYLHCNVKCPSDRCEDLFLRPGWMFLR